MTRSALVLAAIAFLAALGGVFVGRQIVAARHPVESELHSLLHREISLDPAQEGQIHQIEQRFAMRRQAIELELRADNARLAEAIAAEQGYGRRVSEAVDRSHHAMGELQKETLGHIFAMRSVLRPDQAAKFDTAVTKALTAERK